MRPAQLIALCVLLVALAGCDSGSDDAAEERPRPEAAPGQEPARPSERRVIRNWLAALNRGDYESAADFFAPDALVDQGLAYRLPDRTAARTFNSGLPCRADLADLDDAGRRAVASFRLRAGPGGPCSGIVQVRFAFDRRGKFTEFRQLEGQELRPGESA